jgi:hypothetical protein
MTRSSVSLILRLLNRARADQIVKATDENLASEDWALNIEVCDKVTGDGSSGSVDSSSVIYDAERQREERSRITSEAIKSPKPKCPALRS